MNIRTANGSTERLELRYNLTLIFLPWQLFKFYEDFLAQTEYDSYPKDAYVKIKLAEEEVKNKTKSRKKNKTM